ncbi:MAG: rRNA pseudouridine synthase [Armatimonadetes bacterium]|nr:rRNA pseudouridine synthase [Armatimonadota bacterium]
MAQAGIGSRRRCEELIEGGLVKVTTDRILVCGKPLKGPDKPIYGILNKPLGVLTTSRDPQKRKTVLHLIPPGLPRLYPVGRLDADSAGLLLLTNDGELANRLAHPRYGIEKIYRVTVSGSPTLDALSRVRKGITLPEGRTQPCRIRVLRGGPERSLLLVVVKEGKRRQIRRMFQAVGHPVLSLIRTGIGPLELGDLPEGSFRLLRKSEISALKESAGLRLDIPVAK